MGYQEATHTILRASRFIPNDWFSHDYLKKKLPKEVAFQISPIKSLKISQLSEFLRPKTRQV